KFRWMVVTMEAKRQKDRVQWNPFRDLLGEMFYPETQAYFLVLADIMDNSHTHHGQPCWFRVPK
ncbi:hypothetical protein RYX36_009957, partial [Vicia faba]